MVRLIRITWAAPAKSTRAGASTALMVRRTLRPWEPSGTEMEGTSFQGSFSSSRFRPGRHVLDRERVVGAAGDDPLGGAPPCVHGVGAGDRTAGVQGASSSGRAGISLDLSDTPRCPTTTPLARPGAARRWGAGLSPVRAPRKVLPSTAITLRPPMAPTRVRSQDATLASRSSAFTRSSTLRMVDSLGSARPSPGPRSPRSSGPGSATCSRIAPSVRHPARTPTTARHRIAVRQWRTPRLSRGSSTPFRTSFRGRRDRAVVADDDTAARPPP